MAPTTEEAQPAGLSRRQVLLVFVGLMLTILLAALDQTIVNTALPTIAGELHGLDELSWVLTAYLLTSTIGLLIYGKLGDQFGRKGIFLFAIVVFLAGSVLSGLSQTMDQLIAFRALQGVGGGGLMIGAQAIIGDIVTPRERGKYMGLIGGCFGIATVAGPLLGGFFTDHASWRWCFYVNLPIGAIALFFVTFMLHLPKRDRTVRPRLDVLGMILMAGASTCLVLLTTWGGTKYAWDSTVIMCLGAGVVILAALFVLAEYEAAEPIMPLRLFKDSIFNLAGLVGAVVGVAMFGAIGYLPTFIQTVDGASATGSGLLMLPFVAGMLVSSIGSGRIISATGKYKVFPILGTAVAGCGMALLSRMSVDSTRVQNGIYMAVLGLGIGLVMQVLVLVVQNAAPARDMGAATASTNYFRQIGASVGASVVGALFTHRLTDRLTADLPKGLAGRVKIPNVSGITPATLRHLPGPIHRAFVNAFGEALPPIFLYLVPLIGVAFVMSFFLRQIPLRARPQAAASEPAASEPAEATDYEPVAPEYEPVAPESAAPEPAASEPVEAPAPASEPAEPQALPAPTPEPGREPLPVRVRGAAPSPRKPSPYAAPPSYEPADALFTRPPAPDTAVRGWVTFDGGTPAHASATLVDARGQQVDATTTRNGRYELAAPIPGRYMLVCSPIGRLARAGYRPTATYVTVGNGVTEHPIALTR